MDTNELYMKLREHLDDFLMGMPHEPTIIQMLKVMFPHEEAEIALKIPMMDTRLSKLEKLFPELENLEEILDRMVKRGTLFFNQPPGKEKVYRLMTGVGGWTETPFWGGRDTPQAREMAPFYKKMKTRAFSEALAEGAPLVRVIPVMEAVEDSSEVLPYDELIPKIETAKFRAVAHCPCRHASRLRGEGCEHTVENCLHFGTFARYMVANDIAREISCEETIEILKGARNEGLVHVANNMDGHLESICNCCTCGDCYWLVTAKEINRDVLLESNYVARANEDDCTLCGECEERCPMEAIEVEDHDCAQVNPELCIGCGVCTICDDEAIKLIQRKTVNPPPNLAEWAGIRMEAYQQRKNKT